MAPDRRMLGLLALPIASAYLVFFLPSLELLAWLVGFGALALLGMDFYLSRGVAAPDVRLELPDRCRVGRPAAFRVRIQNPRDRGRRVRLLVELPDDLGGDAEFGPIDLPAGSLEVLPLARTPLKRGNRPTGPVEILTRSLLGLYWKRALVPAGAPLAVLPDPGRTADALLTRNRSLAARLGTKPRRPRGEGLEFESLREYVRGNDPRHIDWRATARVGKPIVRYHRVERNHDVVVAVETGRLMSARIRGVSKLDHALNAAVALAYATRSTGDRIGLAAFDRDVHAWVPPIDARRAITPLLNATLPVTTRPFETNYRALASLMGARQKKRSLIVVLTDVAEGPGGASLESYLGLLAKRHCVLLVALRDPLLSSLDEAPADLDVDAVARRLVLQDVLVAREIVLARMRRFGVISLDLHPEKVTGPMLERYLSIREAGLL